MKIEIVLVDGSTHVVRAREAIDIKATEEDIIYSLFSSTIVRLEESGRWVTIDKVMYASVLEE